MANHSDILAQRAHCRKWTVLKSEKMQHWNMSTPWSEGTQYAAGEEWRAITNCSRRNAATGPKWKQHSVVDVSGGESEV